MTTISLRRFNDLLSIVIVVLALYIVLIPLLPAASWWVKYDAPVISSPPQLQLAEEPIPDENTLIIPRLNLREQIHEGETAAALNKGVWRRPATSTPLENSNTVLSGHRFTYSGKSVFYYLDKVQMNDNLYIYWEGKRYVYTVQSIREVAATEVSIEDPTDQPLLTIYTCTPLWSAKNRLAIQARLIEVQP